MTFLRNKSDFPNKCFKANSVKEFSNSPENTFNDFPTVTSPDGFMYLDLFSKDVFFEYKILQKLKTLEYEGSIYLDASLKKYNKAAWETFWLCYNVMQFGYEKIKINYIK